jgi:hypothetical protein
MLILVDIRLFILGEVRCRWQVWQVFSSGYNTELFKSTDVPSYISATHLDAESLPQAQLVRLVPQEISVAREESDPGHQQPSAFETDLTHTSIELEASSELITLRLS